MCVKVGFDANLREARSRGKVALAGNRVGRKPYVCSFAVGGRAGAEMPSFIRGAHSRAKLFADIFTGAGAATDSRLFTSLLTDDQLGSVARGLLLVGRNLHDGLDNVCRVFCITGISLLHFNVRGRHFEDRDISTNNCDKY